MLTYRQALEMILRTIHPLAGEHLPLTMAQHRVLATALIAPHHMPPFDQSLMDGYGLRSADTRMATPAHPVRLRIGQTLTAGEVARQAVPPRQALRIMTGSPLPPGINAVIKMEDGELEAGTLVVRQPVPQGMHVQRRGAEVQRQTVVVRVGERLAPQRIGTALALGIDTAEVVRRPRVALVAPGNELLPPGAPLQPGKKWCSNLYALALRAQEVGGDSINLGIVPDTLDALTERLGQGLDAEVVVILGASGRGDHDFATRAMSEIGAELLFRGVATSPGRSIAVARQRRTLLFGLPGSPWAAFVGFEVFVWPALRALLGQRPVIPPTREAVLTTAVQVRRGVTHFLPVSLQPCADGWQAVPLASLLALARAESEGLGLALVPPHRRCLPQGARVRVQMLMP
jgi:molybdenum cofactor synthesis domain-containing protein